MMFMIIGEVIIAAAVTWGLFKVGQTFLKGLNQPKADETTQPTKETPKE